MIEIKLPRIGVTHQDEIERIYYVIQKTTELGFTYKQTIHDHIKENSKRGSIWAAYLDGQIVGVCTIGSRRLYPHLMRHGEIATLPEFRRKRIATCLYMVQYFQAMLEGRRELEDTIIPALSPWMVGPTECGGAAPGFLPSMSYTYYGTQPKRTSGFKDIALLGKNTIEWLDVFKRVPPDTTFELLTTEVDQATYAKNIENFKKHDQDLAGNMEVLRKSLTSGVFSNVSVIDAAQKSVTVPKIKGGLF